MVTLLHRILYRVKNFSYCSEILAKNLRQLRGERTLVEFARRLGISRSELNRIELQDVNVTIKTLDQLSKSLRCQPYELLLPPEEYRKSQLLKPPQEPKPKNRKIF